MSLQTLGINHFSIFFEGGWQRQTKIFKEITSMELQHKLVREM